jgi:hypothetical protein
MNWTAVTFLGFLASLLAFSANAAPAKVDVCHIPPGNPANAHIINVSTAALNAHLSHGDVSVPDDPTCTAGVGVCAVDGSLECTADGLACDASPLPPLEDTETSCDDGLDNDCDGQIDGADADCAVCPTSTGLQAVITRQIEHKDGACTVDVQVATLTNLPIHLAAQSVDVPTDVVVDSLQTTSCNDSTAVVCRHDMTFDFTTSSSFDGDYALHLQVQCDPFKPLCDLCSSGAEEVVPFTLAGTSCDTTVIDLQPGDLDGTVWSDANGNGVQDAGDDPLVSGSGVMVEIYEDSSPLDGLPDGPAIATSPTDASGDYGFTGLDGTYVVRPVGATGTCPSSGPDSDIDPNTGYSPPLSVIAADPKQVLSGVDLGLTSVCGP